MQLLIRNCIVCSLLVFASTAFTQPLPYQKLVPSYSEDFRDYQSFPSMCFENAHLDSNGRLWVATCGGGSQVNLHLFQFDGYEFKLIKGPLRKLNHLSKIEAFTTDDLAIGSMTEGSNQRLFFFDLKSETLEQLPVLGLGNITHITVREDGRIFCSFSTEEDIRFYELVDRSMNLISQIPRNSQGSTTTNLLSPRWSFLNGNTFWRVRVGKKAIERIDIHASSPQSIDIPVPFPEQFKGTNSGVYKPVTPVLEINGIIYVKIYYSNLGWRLFQIEREGTRFKPIPFLPGAYHEIDVDRDEKGNLVFFFKRTSQVEEQAVLLDVDGRLYDYSAFFTKKAGKTQNLISKDFKKEVLLCKGRGFMVEKVKSTSAIQTYLPGLSIRNMVEYDDQQFLIATQNEPRFLFDAKTNTVSPLELGDCQMSQNSMYVDGEGKIWGTHFSTLIKYDPQTNTCQRFPTESKRNQMIESISEGQFAILENQKRLIFYDVNTETTRVFKTNGEDFLFDGFVHDWEYDQERILWTATTAGLYKIDLENETAELLGSESPFTDRRFLCLDQDEKGRLWLGTPNNGLQIYDPTTQSLKTLNNLSGLANNTVASITADEAGNRWLGTYNGVALVTREGDLIANFGVEDGIVEAESNRYAHLKASDGKIFIGTIKGFSIIDPKLVLEGMQATSELEVYLTSLEYYDAKADQNVTIQRGLSEVTSIELSPANRNFSISFSNSSYFKPQDNKFAYMIEGVDEDWIDIGQQKTLRVNQIPAGNHRLLLKSGDAFGNWTQEPLILNIQAREFFYKQIGFYVLCAFVIVVLAFIWINNLRAAIKRATLKIEEDKTIIEAQAKELKELDQAKSRFFTNISHEFRTPLTIISGVIDQMISKPESWREKGMGMIKRNTSNLLNLVNQILDLRKLESSTLKLDLSRDDLIAYLKYILESFESFAKSNGLTLHFLSDRDQLEMDFDKEKMLSVISNLLSNAIKYTPDGGNIYMVLHQLNEDQLRITVEDTGKGIPEDELPQIFDPFFQANNAGKGTGIGLALSYELVQLFGGDLGVESTVGKGSRFIMTLPIRLNEEVDSQMAPPPLNTPVEVKSMVSGRGLWDEKTAISPQAAASPSDEKPILLIVEDNEDVTQYLIACLEDTYQLVLAENGQIGVDKAVETIPDLIISDVMMPEKDGFQLCDELKQDERTSHIPILLLTAKADEESRIKGFSYGADAYLLKPFNPEELYIRLEKLHQQRLQLQARFSSMEAVPADQPEEEKGADLSRRESEFLQKLQDAIEANLSDENFGITELCRTANVSRAQLHRKIKSLTSRSTSHFIRSVRLHRAKSLLESGDLNITEVAFEVGIPNLPYFSRTFSQEYGAPPSDFLPS